MKVAQILEGFDNDIEDLLFIGESESNFVGLVDHPNITQGSLTTGNWDAAGTTGQEIVDDVKAIITAMVVANNRARPDRSEWSVRVRPSLLLSPVLLALHCPPC